MKKTNEFGFTLIELLVVISIIGLLSTMAVISLNSARAKSRDAKRVSDIKSLSTIIEMERANLGDSVALTGCAANNVLTTTCTTGELSTQAANFVDPTAGAASPCAATPAATCGYSIGARLSAAAPTTSNYEICAYLESGASGFTGDVSVSSGGVLNNTCAF